MNDIAALPDFVIDSPEAEAQARELIARLDAKRDILAYCKYMANTGLRDFEFPPVEHHKLLISHFHHMLNGTPAS